MKASTKSDSPPSANQAAMVARLLSPDAYDERPARIDHIETHISHVFLTERRVYKLKKAVRFDFLDFSTPTLREQACRDELRLNRRLAPDVYLDVVPITLDDVGVPQLGGPGPVVDFVVKMRRLPDDRMLDHLVRTDRLTARDGARIAEFLAERYVDFAPLVIRPEVYLDALEAHICDNRRTLLTIDALDPAQVRRLHTWALRFLFCRSEVLRGRVIDGRVIDGHGDLRPEHVCLTDPPAVFDCLEFSAELRRVDVLDELCFLAMECDALAAPQLGERILDSYVRRSHDDPSLELTNFYKSYRAAVRAKVAALRASQLAGAEQTAQFRSANAYLDLADGYDRAAGRRPLLIAVTGLMGTGKSTLAAALGERLGVDVLRTDAIRDELFAADGVANDFGTGRYRDDARSAVYDRLTEAAEARLAKGESVVVDGTFSAESHRSALRAVAERQAADVLWLECVCPRATSLERIAHRLAASDDPSEARPELYDRQAAEREPASVAMIPVDTTASLNGQLRTVADALSDVA